MVVEKTDTPSDTLAEEGNQHSMLQNALQAGADLSAALGNLYGERFKLRSVPRDKLDKAASTVHDVVMEFADTLEGWESSGTFKSTSRFYGRQTSRVTVGPTHSGPILSAYTLEDASSLRQLAKRAADTKLTLPDFRDLYAVASSLLHGVRLELDAPRTATR